MAEKLLSVVVSVYNEEAVLEQFFRETGPVLENLKWNYELLFVNDGSRDKSLEIVKGMAERDPHVKVVSFSRNFGHEAAMIAGIDHNSGDGIVCMDADLQHPPACLEEIIEKLAEEGVAANVHYKPLPMHTAYKRLGFLIEDYPNSYKLFENEITLPLHTKLTDEEAEYVLEKYSSILAGYLKSPK